MEESIYNKAVELRHQLHAGAELSCHETNTKRTLMGFIKRNTEFEVVDRGLWFYVHVPSTEAKPQKTIGFRADMDALPLDDTFTPEELPWCSCIPGVSHKCGHDGHSATMAGFALSLWSAVQSGQKIPNDIYLVFQHAEEIGVGGEPCSALVEEKGIDEMYAFHNWSGFPRGAVRVSDRLSQCGSRGVRINIHGACTHASEPEHGLNPSFALAQLALAVRDAENAGDYQDLTMATIVGMSSGAENYGIAAAEAWIALTLRASFDSDLEKLRSRILTKAEELCTDGLIMDFTESDIFPAVVNDPQCAAKVRAAAASAGIQVVPMDKPYRSSEDFSWFLLKTKGALFYVGNGEDYPAIHTARYDFVDSNIKVACDTFMQLALS